MRQLTWGEGETLTIEELLLRVRGPSTADGGARARHIRYGPCARSCGSWRGPSCPFSPLTAGQLATFANDGTATPHPLVVSLQPAMRQMGEMLATEEPDAD